MAGQGSNDKIAGLLKQACPPAAASPEFKARLRQQVNQQAAALGTQSPKPLWQQPFVWIPAAAAMAVAAALVIYFVAFNSTQPAVTTNGATNIATTSATLNGDLTSLGTADNVTLSFEWGTATGSYGHTTSDQARTSIGTFSADLSGITPGATYYYRAKADGDGPPVYGDEKSFTTFTTQPVVITNDPTKVTTTSATLNGTLDGLGTADNVTVSFEWRTESGSYTQTTADQSRTSVGAFSADLSGLDHGTTYYYKAKADGDGLPVYGDEKSFTTFTTQPVVVTNDPTKVTTTSATLNGTLDGLGTADNVTVSFEWRTESGSYTQTTADQSRTSVGAFSADLSGLDHGTTYYYRAKADGDGLPVYGGEKKFTTATPNLPPVAEAGGPYNVDEGSALTLVGSGFDPEGGALTYAWDLDSDGVFETAGATPVFRDVVDGPDAVTVTLQVCDQFGLCATDTAIVTAANVPPAVGAITAPIDPVRVNTVINTSAKFTDPGIFDTHSPVWDWGDGLTSSGTLNETDGSGSVTDNHTYAKSGVYSITLTVTDKDGGQSSVTVDVTVVGEPTKQLVSCDSAGNPMEQFAVGQSVYVKGTGLDPKTRYRIWIQDNPVAEGDGLVIREDPSGSQEDVTTDENGAFGPVETWPIPLDWQVSYHSYDIVADRQDDGNHTRRYNSASDGIDSFAAVGFVAPVPELTTLILLGTGTGFLLLGGWMVLRKRNTAAE